jgi:hypothetical protein
MSAVIPAAALLMTDAFINFERSSPLISKNWKKKKYGAIAPRIARTR